MNPNISGMNDFSHLQIDHSGGNMFVTEMPTTILNNSGDHQYGNSMMGNNSSDHQYGNHNMGPNSSHHGDGRSSKQTVSIKLNIPERNERSENEMAHIRKAGLVVNTAGHQWKRPVQSLVEEHFTEEEDKLIGQIAGTFVAANEMIQASVAKTDQGQNDVPIENELDDVAINTMVVSNDDSGAIKMTFTDSAVGRFETIDEKNGVSRNMGTIEDEKYLGVNMCGFSPLQGNAQRSRSRKTVKPARFIENENCYVDDDPRYKKLKIESDEGQHAYANKTGKKKGKKDKKNKLNVDEVYDSGASDGDDLSKDVLKVRMCKCDTCGKHFLDREKLDSHKLTKHGQKKAKRSRNVDLTKEFTCEICGYVFRRREHWRRHKIVHSKETPYKCEFCGRGFKRPEHVRRHQSVHTGEKPFHCDRCDKKFTRNEHLQKHIQMHLGKNPYVNKKKKSKTPSTSNRMTPSVPPPYEMDSTSDTSSMNDSPRKVMPRQRLTVIDY